ncbi:hypothetical protein EB796_022372 [Bugula neritina]|uniref:WSC domain-containing protein n=1 Tax=Bugula neritina TaxID=10212 RepID=A0A7J7J0W7_BUGNE|nr:hypothetical protein EB796_022372 [Bugula neritina]
MSDNDRQVHIGNYTESLSKYLKLHFGPCLVKDPLPQRNEKQDPFGFVVFENPEKAKACIESRTATIQGQTVVFSPAKYASICIFCSHSGGIMAEAQPARNIPTGQTPLREHLYQPLSTEHLQFSFQQKYASPYAYYTSYTQPQTEYASCTQQPPENAQQGNSTEPPAYEFLTGWQMGVRDSQPQPAVKDTSSKCWLAVGILISIVFIPLSALGVMGVIKAIEAANEAKSGNAAEYKKKICRSKAYGLTGIGLLLLLITIITAASRNLLEALPVNLMFPLHPIIFIWDALRITNLEILMVMNIILEMIFLLRIVPTTAPKEVTNMLVLQNGFFCSCGTSYGSYGELDQDECSSVCSADGMECGGLYSNSIYRTNYIGCYKDYNETFDYHIDLPDDEVTPSSCTKHCKTDGYRFAGLWSGRYCYCEDHFNRFDEVPDEECNWGCPGNSELSCGGALRQSVYNTFN